MSLDLEIWLTGHVELAELLISGAWIEDESGVWVREARTWQILVGPADRVEREDVPDEVAAVAPGPIGWRVGVGLEGRRTGEAARELRSLTQQIAAEGRGVIADATGLYGADGSKYPITPSRKPETVSVLRLSWVWTDDSPAQTRDGLVTLVSQIEGLLPEALPRRWDITEPPQHRLDELGLESFIDFVDTNRDDGLVWLPKLPVRAVDLDDRRRWKVDAGFAANRLTIDVDAGFLGLRGTGRRVAKAFESIAVAVRPFYAEARMLRGFTAIRPYDLQSEPDRTDVDPLYRNLWRGVPRKTPRAVILGPPYIGRWPDLDGSARRQGALLVACPPSLTVADDQIPPPPDAIAQRFDPYWCWSQHRYPSGVVVPSVTVENPSKTPAYWPF